LNLQVSLILVFLSTAIKLLIEAVTRTTYVLLNQNLFTSPDLPPGQHTITITFSGDALAAALTIDYFEVTTNPTDEAAPSAVSTSASSTSMLPSSMTQTSSASSRINRGTIVGGIVGAIAFLVLCGIALWYMLRKRSHETDPGRRSIEPSDENFSTLDLQPDPLILPMQTSERTDSSMASRLAVKRMSTSPGSSQGLEASTSSPRTDNLNPDIDEHMFANAPPPKYTPY
jgi:hypothetical protein